MMNEKTKLEIIATLLNEKHDNRRFKVEETYLDFGADLKWDTIICYNTEDRRALSYQIFSPAEKERALRIDSLEELEEYVDNFRVL